MKIHKIHNRQIRNKRRRHWFCFQGCDTLPYRSTIYD
ncbi:MAG: hypothetical protein K6F00_02615 [Lachnospiraceae bacterium]|nr:hypothetical protein [Lachnospiraceae bacterium]